MFRQAHGRTADNESDFQVRDGSAGSEVNGSKQPGLRFGSDNFFCGETIKKLIPGMVRTLVAIKLGIGLSHFLQGDHPPGIPVDFQVEASPTIR